MSDGGVELEGLAEATRDIARWVDQLPGVVARASGSFASTLASTVAGKVPHLSGQLASTVSAHAVEEGTEVSLGGGLPYAGYIEFGGRHGRPYVPQGRYLYPSALDAQDEYVAMASAAAEDSVGAFLWST